MKISILNSTDPYLNLAIEEYLYKYSNEDIFLLWQNEPTVVIGKNQNPYTEIDIDYVSQNNIHIARRITGGGAVYHDLGNLNFSFICNKTDNDINFKIYCEPIIKALKHLNLEVELSGRNDITVNGKKISGNAQTSSEGRVLHHGTILYDTNFEIMSKALRFSKVKYESKAISSFRSRVANLKDITGDKFNLSKLILIIKESIEKEYSAESFKVQNNEIIYNLKARNESFDWIFPNKKILSEYSFTNEKKFDCGLIQIKVYMEREVIKAVNISGDFFGEKDIDELESLFEGCHISEIEAIISKNDPSNYIKGIKANEIISLFKTEK